MPGMPSSEEESLSSAGSDSGGGTRLAEMFWEPWVATAAGITEAHFRTTSVQ